MGIPPFFPLCEMTGGPPLAHQPPPGRPRVGHCGPVAGWHDDDEDGEDDGDDDDGEDDVVMTIYGSAGSVGTEG